jgi:hypothetical protein
MAVAEGEMLEALEALERLLAKSEETVVATTGVGAGVYMLLEDKEDDDCAILVDEGTRELVWEDEDTAGEDVGVGFGVGDDDDVKVDVAALELTVDVAAIEDLLDFVELVDVAAAELLVVVGSSDELDNVLVELEDGEGLVVELVVEKIWLEVELDRMLDDEDVNDAVELGDDATEEDVPETLEEESDEEVTAVTLKPAPTPGPENVPVAVLKTTLDCVTVGFM